jgi:hypothetical protein
MGRFSKPRFNELHWEPGMKELDAKLLTVFFCVFVISIPILVFIAKKMRSVRRSTDEILPRIALLMLSFAVVTCLWLLLYIGLTDGTLTLIGKRHSLNIYASGNPAWFWCNIVIYWFGGLIFLALGIGTALPAAKGPRV